MTDSVPKRTEVPIGASITEIRAVILSSPWSSATGSGVIAPEAAFAATSPEAASTMASLIYGRD
jgi:hypothetical protein